MSFGRVAAWIVLCGAVVGCGPSATSSSASSSDGGGDAVGATDAAMSATSAADSGPSPSTTASTVSTTGSADDATSDSDDPDDGTVSWDCGSQAPPGTQTHCTAAPCDVFEQNCGGDGKCVPFLFDKLNYGGTTCVSVGAEPGLAGDACTHQGGLDGCDYGLMCYFVSPQTEEGICTPLCEGAASDPICTAEGTACMDEVPVCLGVCDPLGPDACGDGQTCTCADSCVCAQQAEEPAEYLEPCDGPGFCDDGLACIAGDQLDCMAEFCCTPYCDANVPESCPDVDSGQTCVPLPDGPPGLGICVL